MASKDIEIIEADEIDDDSYVMSSCTECRRRMRANRLRHFTMEVESGRRTGRSSSFYYGRRASSRTGRSSSTSYKNVAKRMCAECYAKYEAQVAASRRTRMIGIVVVGGFIAFALLSSGSKTTTIPSSKSPIAVEEPVGAPSFSTPTTTRPATYEPQAAPTFSAAPIVDQTPQPTRPEPPLAPTPPPEDYYIVNYLANVRATPGGAVVGQAAMGEELSVVETKGSWSRVRRGDQIIGWVHRNLLTPSR